MKPNLDRLKEDIGTSVVYDVVPNAERDSYRYWRGLSLVRMALELSRGNRSLELDGNPVHFADFHTYAFNVAKDIANGGCSITQTSGAAESGIRGMLDDGEFTFETPHPALVVAHKDKNPHTFPSDMGMGHGFCIYGRLTDLDEHLRQFIEDYFEVRLATMPPRPLLLSGISHQDTANSCPYSHPIGLSIHKNNGVVG